MFGERMEKHNPDGLEDAYGLNLKRLVAGELDKDADIRNDLAVLNKIFVLNAGRIMNAAGDSVEDLLQARKRKEIKGEERQEEMEEAFNKTVETASGVNSQMQSINQVIAEAMGGIMQQLISAGILKVNASMESKKEG
jgi:hypothetical protein